VQHIVVAIVVAAGYAVLALVSAEVAYAPTVAWTVWLASGALLGSLLTTNRARWGAVLAGGFAGAAGFTLYLGSPLLDALAFGACEVVTSLGAALLVSRLAALPLRLDNPRELAALVFGGALPLALGGGLIATGWHMATGGELPGPTFRLWVLSNFIGTLLVSPMFVAWSRFRVLRSGGMTMPAFIAGAVACALFLISMQLLFDASPDSALAGTTGRALTYVPIVFMALGALLWGTRGATLTAFAGALIAMVNTSQGQGPFAGIEGYLGDPVLEVEGYALALTLTGLLIAVLVSAQSNATRAARDWQTRFEAAIGAHRLLAYEWDPVSNHIIVSGDSKELVGLLPARIATLAEWLALVVADDRGRVAARFDERVQGHGESDTMTYLVVGPGGSVLAATDEARVIRGHDGALHRVVGIVRVAATAAAGVVP